MKKTPDEKSVHADDVKLSAKEQALLEYANAEFVEQYANEFDDIMAEAAALDIDFTETDKVIYAQIEKLDVKEKRDKKLRSLQKAAIIALIFITVFGVTFGGFMKYSIAFRAKIYDIFGKEEEKALNYQFGNTGIIPENWQGNYAITELPEGFKITNITVMDHIYLINYENKDGGWIEFTYYLDSVGLSVDNENRRSKVVINGSDGVIFEKGNGTLSIQWQIPERGGVADIFTNLSMDEVVLLAESVRLIK